jgi:hypothetical protein
VILRKLTGKKPLRGNSLKADTSISEQLVRIRLK